MDRGRQQPPTSLRYGLTVLAFLYVFTGANQLAAQDDWTGATEKETPVPAVKPDAAALHQEPASPSLPEDVQEVAIADGQGLFHTQHTFPSGAVIVVEESRDEPRSIGSYTIRLYSGADPRFPLDDFRDGLVLARDGFIEQVHFLAPGMLIVVLRSAGSGSYLSGTLVRAESKLEVMGTLEGLPPDAELVENLRALAAGYTPQD